MTSVTTQGSTARSGPGFDPDLAYELHPKVEVRPEPFGALLYSFLTRRLSFLKDPTLVIVVRSLADHPSARSACAAAGVTEGPRLASFFTALSTLSTTSTIRERES